MRIATNVQNLRTYKTVSSRLFTTTIPGISVSDRCFSSVYAPPVPVAIVRTAVGKGESREFMAVFPDIVRDLTEVAGKHTDIPDVMKWYTKVLQYNVPNGKKNRGLALVAAYKSLANETELTSQNLRLANIMGWCVEMLQAFFLVLDDLMDGAETRRNRLCWYRYDDNGLNAINDSIFLENGIYTILKKYFSDKQYYVPILETFHDITLKTAMGQSLDIVTAKCFKSNKLDKFTMDRYKSIVKYKTSYYSFQLPVSLAMFMSEIYDAEKHRQAKSVLLEMGHYFQVQDDYLDCFGDPDVIGKIGTDIKDGKCSWLIVVALQRATPEQKSILQKCYGQDDDDKINTVKNVYKEIGIPALYAAYEEESYNLMLNQIQMLSTGLSQDIFYKILDKIYKRRS